jgi:hypothetical protein
MTMGRLHLREPVWAMDDKPLRLTRSVSTLQIILPVDFHPRHPESRAHELCG